VPITIIKDHSLPETVRFTWIQLRCLAWGRSETPVLSMKQIVDILGKKQSAVYKHMAMLRDQGALRWRPAGCGTFIVSFPDHLQDDRSSGVCETNSKRLGSAQSPENNSTNMESPFNVFVNNSYQKEEKLKKEVREVKNAADRVFKALRMEIDSMPIELDQMKRGCPVLCFSL